MTTPHLPNNLRPAIDPNAEDQHAAALDSIALAGRFSSSSPHGHLFERILWASAHLKPVQPEYCVLYEDPDEPDAPVKIMNAAPEWLAMALHGNLLPPIEAYLADQAKVDAYVAEHGSHEGFSWDQVGGAAHPYADPTGPMTEEQAMEYLIQKDIPRRVWDRPGSNRSLVAIVRRDTVPTDQTHRDAWRLTDFARAA